MILFLVSMSIWSTLGSIPAGWLALFGTIFGGIGLKVFEAWINRDKTKSEGRRDLNDEINTLVTRVNTLEEEITFWRNQFYREQEENAGLRVTMVNGGLTPPPKAAMPDAPRGK